MLVHIYVGPDSLLGARGGGGRRTLIPYALALAAAAAGDRTGARRRLGEAIEHVPELRAEALDDPLLSDLVDS